uniref:Uncharacterized protein n=1 Tax=Rhizophora mucronata TaxID=61149 RepID=A0A2P2KR76_RHIMU
MTYCLDKSMLGEVLSSQTYSKTLMPSCYLDLSKSLKLKIFPYFFSIASLGVFGSCFAVTA